MGRLRSVFASWQAWALLSALFAAMTTIFAKVGVQRIDADLATLIRVLIILVLVATLVLVPLFAPGFEGELLDLTVTLSQILFPILILLGITGIVVGVLNSNDRFAAFAISPFFWNVAIIAVLVLLAPAFHGDNRSQSWPAR